MSGEEYMEQKVSDSEEKPADPLFRRLCKFFVEGDYVHGFSKLFPFELAVMKDTAKKREANKGEYKNKNNS